MEQSTKRRVLVAEDESVIALNLRAMLERLGYEVLGEAATGQQAVEMAAQMRPDVILMDIKMPEMDGLTAARKIAEENPVPVIIITAYYDNDFLARAKASGVFGYLVKPVTERDLVPAIEIACDRFREARAAHEEVQHLEQTLADRRLIERAKGIIMQQWRISEAEAYRRLQKESQDKRMAMAELARNMLRETGLL